jgi:hypothetical protein
VSLNRCPRCGDRNENHDGAAELACAWRGQPCRSCGYPPHRDGAHDCPAYTHPSDSARRRALRAGDPNPPRGFDEVAVDDPERDKPWYQEVLAVYESIAASHRGQAPAHQPQLPGIQTPPPMDW